MGKDRHNHRRRQHAKGRHSRLGTIAGRRNPHAPTAEPYSLLSEPGLVPYLRLDAAPAPDALASDGTVSALASLSHDVDELTWAVFDGAGHLRWVLLVLNAPQMSDYDRGVLGGFRDYRELVGEDPVAFPEPSGRHRRGFVRLFRFMTVDAPAADGTRSVLVSEFNDERAVLVLDADRFVVDNLAATEFTDFDETGRASMELLEFLARRAQVRDPLFIDPSENFGAALGGER